MRLAALFLLLSTAAQAGDLRCGTHLITEGASQYELLQKCGEPVYKQWIREPVLALRNRRLVIQDSGRPGGERVIDAQEQEPEYREIERWTYDPGSGSFLRFVDFDQGRIIRITLGPRS
ncbi:MAG: DUF2845 domain-containing protein [Gammaproteobacteria bacterium]|nr:DUF2845 domain-containing protein [Gammaproteobacteria bacterium]